MKPLWIFIVFWLILGCSKARVLPEASLPVAVDTLVNKTDTTLTEVDSIFKPVEPPVIRPPDPFLGKRLNYLALGDSYTIGEAVENTQNFPNQFVRFMADEGWIVHPPRIIAKTGWTTSELQQAIAAAPTIETFDIVTLLIGVNNQYRGESSDAYRNEFKQLLESAIAFAGDEPGKVFVISIPDWGVTPFAQQSGRDPELISSEIDAFNAINKAEAEARGVSYIDITPGSRRASSDLELLASDGLHPSAKMYSEWAERLSRLVLTKQK